jgi:hypothetical protein
MWGIVGVNQAEQSRRGANNSCDGAKRRSSMKRRLRRLCGTGPVLFLDSAPGGGGSRTYLRATTFHTRLSELTPLQLCGAGRWAPVLRTTPGNDAEDGVELGSGRRRHSTGHLASASRWVHYSPVLPPAGGCAAPFEGTTPPPATAPGPACFTRTVPGRECFHGACS